MPTYDDPDNKIMANYVFHRLCELDEVHRKANSEPEWHDIVLLAEEVGAIDNKVDVAYLAENALLHELGFIERDVQNTNIRLTSLGRENCARGIDIPPSDNQVPLR